MPFLFIHGVNNRQGEDYERGIELRHKFLEQFTFPQLTFASGKKLRFLDPYWGKAGAVPRWQNRSMPNHGTANIPMGEGQKTILETAPINIDFRNGDPAALLKIARNAGIKAALDVLILQFVKESEGIDSELTSFALAAQAYCEVDNLPKWLSEVETDEDFLFQLSQELKESFPPAKTANVPQGPNNFWQRVNETAGRLKNSFGDHTSELLVKAWREGIQNHATLFLGDAFIYFNERFVDAADESRPKVKEIDSETKKNVPSYEEFKLTLKKEKGKTPGKIPEIVLEDLFDAHESKTKDDPYLIVMAHSMGGNIIYDLCTDFLGPESELKIDLLITVGSQFSMFQEIDMFNGVELPTIIEKETQISKPKNIISWINIFDKNDIFAYQATPVFSDVEDFEYETGFGGIGGPHGGYFRRFSFYDRLGKRILAKLGSQTPAISGAKT